MGHWTNRDPTTGKNEGNPMIKVVYQIYRAVHNGGQGDLRDFLSKVKLITMPDMSQHLERHLKET